MAASKIVHSAIMHEKSLQRVICTVQYICSFFPNKGFLVAWTSLFMPRRLNSEW